MSSRPTFDDVATAIDAVIAQCAPGPLILYMHDIGGPIGMRVATAHPEPIAGLIFQNMTTSVEGWNPERVKVYERLGGPETPENLAEAEQFTTVDGDMFLHKRGSRQPGALRVAAHPDGASALRTSAARALSAQLTWRRLHGTYGRTMAIKISFLRVGILPALEAAAEAGPRRTQSLPRPRQLYRESD